VNADIDISLQLAEHSQTPLFNLFGYWDIVPFSPQAKVESGSFQSAP
jgi:hypothetical protein